MKEPTPKIDLEISDVADIQSLSEKELKLVPYDKKKWQCCVANCNRYANIKYYGPNAPILYRGDWVDISDKIFFCPTQAIQFEAWRRN